MNKTEELTSRPILVWENSNSSSGGEASVREIRTGSGVETTMPVIRVISSGFGAPQAVKAKAADSTNKQLRCAA
ncbi:hypothetical protein SD71_16780 [Cohnella kolymensis]|uniref:Uncharacterized protein n=1 Tax=Cohnella kolymensis TaxID=1590652 RepID=A0ABR5A0Y2_9BACL|nr:hypothetical protein [Cohnella kolymensis]KIL34721.1 hypothetical protein SD71_16780 [Cohnella kolymensis]